LVCWFLSSLSIIFQLYSDLRTCRDRKATFTTYWPMKFPAFGICMAEYQEKVTDKLYHIMLYRVHLAWARFELTTWVVIGTDCTYYNDNTCILYSSWGRQSTRSTQPNKQPTGYWLGNVSFWSEIEIKQFERDIILQI
jgi:hypothetical protein